MATKKPANPFDAIAKPKEAKKASSVKIAAEVTAAVKTAVDEVISIKAEINRKKAELDAQETIVIDHVSPQQDSKARSGEFSKSFYVEGNTGALTYSTADSFSVPKDEAVQETVKTLIGEEKFNEWFKTKRTISLKEGLDGNTELINKITGAITKAGLDLADVFTVTDVLVHVDDLDRKQYDLDDQTLAEFRALVVPRKASLKPIVKA
jgi:hypothetical protein